jgi:hypothetical protein
MIGMDYSARVIINAEIVVESIVGMALPWRPALILPRAIPPLVHIDPATPLVSRARVLNWASVMW